MSMKQDGGRAFPLSREQEGWFEGGMTLRDYFAAQALAGGMARTTVPEYELRAMFGPTRTCITRDEIAAADAYRIADAMLAERSRE